ncbi:MAG: DUF3429 domain-containing protein [Thiotrichales bacterium]|nr:DUF3429 domain-containing protein [Thiotrichales bacterium]
MTPWHVVLGYAGLIPFIGLPLLMVWGSAHFPQAAFWLISYAALIFSFLGGVQWMATLKAEDQKNSTFKQIMSVSVMLWAWLWLIVPQIDWFILAGLSFWALWIYEYFAMNQAYPKTFIQMRRNLSLVAGVSLMSAGLL